MVGGHAPRLYLLGKECENGATLTGKFRTTKGSHEYTDRPKDTETNKGPPVHLRSV